MGVMATHAKMTGTRQTGTYLPMPDYLLIQRAAAMQRTTMSAALLKLMETGLAELRANPPTRDDEDD